MNNIELAGWVYDNSGPILKHRLVEEFGLGTPELRQILCREALGQPEIRRWQDALAQSHNIHGSRDQDAENPLAKLLEYGFDGSLPAIQDCLHLLDSPLKSWEPIVLVPFLVRAGFTRDPRLADWLISRIEKLYHSASTGSFDFYYPPEEAAGVPNAWKGKPIYRDEYGHTAGYSLPTCYDLYSLSYCPPVLGGENLQDKLETIAAFLSDPRFQSTQGGYGWDRVKRRCYAAGRVFLACVMPARLVLFLELAARFESARESNWFQEGLGRLESHRTRRGSYLFPRELLTERTGTHLYAGCHMGLGEDRRKPLALELESSFHMLYIYKRMGRISGQDLSVLVCD